MSMTNREMWLKKLSLLHPIRLADKFCLVTYCDNCPVRLKRRSGLCKEALAKWLEEDVKVMNEY